MAAADEHLELTLMGEKFRLKAPLASHDRLQSVAQMVNERIQALHRDGGALTLQRATLMSAFQFAYEVREKNEQSGMSEEECSMAAQKIESLITHIEEEMHNAEA